MDEDTTPDPAPAAEEMTFASRLPSDHPGLRLERPQARSLRRGPIVVVGATLFLAVVVALAIAFSPKGERAHASGTESEETHNVTVSDTIKNAPGDNAELPTGAPPKLGPPLHGADLPKASLADAPAKPPRVGAGFARSSLRETIREEREKASSSAILVDLEALSGSTGAPLAPTAPGADAIAPAARTDLAPSAPPLVGAGTGDPNRQQDKTEFLARESSNTSTSLAQPLVLPRSPYEVKAGTIIPASLLTAINSDLPGQIIAQVRENVYDTVTGSYLLIPQGSRLLAAYDAAVSYGQGRVLFCWNRVIRPDGGSLSLQCMPGADLAGASGAADEVDHHWWRTITGVALGTLLSATADRAAGNVTGYQPTVAQSWASNAGGALNTAGQQITQRNLAIQPTITVRAGYSVNVVVAKDIVLLPYANQGVSR